MTSNLLENQSNALRHLSQWKVGALFMEAGTGKTRIAIEIIEQSPCDVCLWVCPLRVIDNTKAEFAKWGCRVPVRYVGVESIGMSDRIYLETLEFVQKAKNPFVVVDESLKIKNLTAKRTHRLLSIGKLAEYKLILNGTPLSKNLMDLYPQMQFISPAILNMSPARFKNTYCKYQRVTEFSGSRMYSREYITGYANVEHLMSLVRNYVFEAKLSLDVTQDYNNVMAYIGDESREAYKSIKERYLSYDELLRYNNNIFMAMTQELQHSYCCDPSKIEAVRKVLAGEDAKRAIIFCKFVDSRELCERTFPDVKVLSYQKESLGLNLQDYSVMIFFDKTFDYALRLQASRRVYRVGQASDCKYYDITCDTGLEMMIDRCISKKMGLLEYFKSKANEEIIKEL